MGLFGIESARWGPKRRTSGQGAFEQPPRHGRLVYDQLVLTALEEGIQFVAMVTLVTLLRRFQCQCQWILN